MWVSKEVFRKRNKNFNISGFIIPQRVVMAIMGFFAIVNAYTMRICLSVAIVEMVKKKTSSGNDEHECPAREGSNSVVIISYLINLRSIYSL